MFSPTKYLDSRIKTNSHSWCSGRMHRLVAVFSPVTPRSTQNNHLPVFLYRKCEIESSIIAAGAIALLLLLSHSNLQICLVKWHYGKIIQNQTNPLVALTIGHGYAGKLNVHSVLPSQMSHSSFMGWITGK